MSLDQGVVCPPLDALPPNEKSSVDLFFMRNVRPQRRWHLRIEIGADSWEAVEHSLRELAFTLGEKERTRRVDIISGGSDAGYTVDGIENPEMTHERYFKLVDAWKVDRKKLVNGCSVRPLV